MSKQKLLLLIIVFISASLFVNSSVAENRSEKTDKNKSYFTFSPDGKYLCKVFQLENKTWVRIHETGEMGMVAQWQIPDFYPHTIRFSKKDSRKLMMADKNRLLVYKLIDGKQKLLFIQPETKGQEIVQASFDSTTPLSKSRSEYFFPIFSTPL